MILLAAAIFTILFHYSTFLFKLLSGGNAMEYLSDTPNLILPIYPCNVVMWSALIFAFLKNKKSRVGLFFADYLAVWVLKGNECAIKFYERYGFRFDGTEQENELGTPNTELRMIFERK